MKQTTKFVLSILTIFLATFAAAQTTFTLTGTGGQSVGGYGIYPYYGQLNDGPIFTVMCDDFTTDVGVPSTWNANLTDLSTGNLSNTKFGSGPGALRSYEEAFWLFGQTSTPTGSADLAGLQLTIWSLFDTPGDPVLQGLIESNGYAGDVSYWLTLASADASTNLADYSGDIIISPASGQTGQEQLESTPEPGTLILFGSGILGLSNVLRKRSLW